MNLDRPLCALLVAAIATCGLSLAVDHRIDGTLPQGGDCALYGVWDVAANSCRIESSRIDSGNLLRIEFATVEVVGTLTNEGMLDNRGTLIVDGFLNSTKDLVNFWDGTMIVRGEFFSHFMYNFGGLTNESTGTIEFELHLENNAPMTNHGHIDIVGNYINIPARRLDNLGSIAIASTGTLTNAGRLVHAGSIANSGVLQNEAELIEHCESSFTGIPAQGLPATGAQSLYVGGTSLEWCPIDGALGYDVVEGDLHLLRSGGGDFSVATTTCLGSDLVGVSLEHDRQPDIGEGLWFLVRAEGVSSADYDTVFTSQSGSRISEIGASTGSCP